jgi:hypothetical protein
LTERVIVHAFSRFGAKHADCPVGCDDTNHTTGWSSRVMFRPEGEAVSYTYFQDKAKDCGEDLSWNVKFLPGQFHEVKVYMRVNSPGAHALPF